MDLCAVLLGFTIRAEELVQGGGGESSATQRLRYLPTDQGRRKRKINIVRTVDGKERASMTHMIDHGRATQAGARLQRGEQRGPANHASVAVGCDTNAAFVAVARHRLKDPLARGALQTRAMHTPDLRSG